MHACKTYKNVQDMNVRVRIAVLSFTSLIILVSQIPLSFAPYSSTKTVAASGTIVYHTYIVTTLTELTNVISKVVPGDTVLIRGGTYRPTSLAIRFTVSGTPNQPISWEAYANEKVIFDGSDFTGAEEGWPAGSWQPAMTIARVNWNIFRNLEVRNNQIGMGFLLAGDDNICDSIETHHHAGLGLFAEGNRNLILKVHAHHCVDPQDPIPGGDADGIEVTRGSGNIVRSCLTHDNSDDGIDTWDSTDTLVEKCVSHSNGLLQGDGNGFKLGRGTGSHAVKCVAYNNKAAGFSPNTGTLVVMDHCTGWKNSLIDFQNWVGDDQVTYSNNIGTFYKETTPTEINNTWNLGITDFGFISTDPASSDFLSLRADSPCRGKASDGSDLGALQYGERISDLLGT